MLDDVQYLNVEYLRYYVRITADVDVVMKSKRSLHTHVKLKDRKRSLRGKKLPQRVVVFEEQLQREISWCGCF
jgi:hypothetical protein